VGKEVGTARDSANSPAISMSVGGQPPLHLAVRAHQAEQTQARADAQSRSQRPSQCTNNTNAITSGASASPSRKGRERSELSKRLILSLTPKRLSLYLVIGLQQCGFGDDVGRGFRLKPVTRAACCSSGALRPFRTGRGVPGAPALGPRRAGFSYRPAILAASIQ
jgi:hypothetical protein